MTLMYVMVQIQPANINEIFIAPVAGKFLWSVEV